MRAPSLRALLGAAATALCVAAAPIAAQLTDPGADWRTVRTEHFAVHYRAEAEGWTLPMAQRLEAVRAEVERLVGYAPPGVVDVLVTDPFALANGAALPHLDHPLLLFFPTPPDPRIEIGEHRGWSELLAVHEFGHLAHLTRPSRNPVDRALWRLSPLPLGPIALRAPRWVVEGYATYVEGRLTGSGRPYGVWRPTVLRQWAIEGKLPKYGDLDEVEGFRAGSMAYLTGSAFLEWLVRREGEESLRNLWRRLSARQRRGFGEAFAGVYGGTPEDLYGRFSADLVTSAVLTRRSLEAAGLQEGETVQKLEGETGDPTVSPDGAHLALVLAGEGGESRLVVWRTAEEPEDSAEVRRRERRLARDLQDVPDVPWRPREKEPVAVLRPRVGYPHAEPRFFRDGERILVVRSEPRGGGELVPDLFVWRWRDGGVERVTRGAGIQSADPAPDGRTAVGVRCRGGACSLVRIGLEDGRVEELVPGTPDRVLYRPRVSPDGSAAAVAVQERGRWRVARVDLAAPSLRFVDPDDGADRYDAAFSPDGRSLLVVSHRTGAPNLERIDLASGAVEERTRVTGAAVAPEPSAGDGSVYFLSLHAGGFDLNRLPPGTAPVEPAEVLDVGFAAATPVEPDAPADTFAAGPPLAPRPYGAGPRRWRWAAGGSQGPEGESTLFALLNTDPVGRLTFLLQGGGATGAAWGGASAGIGWRGWGPTLRLEAFHAVQEPDDQRAEAFRGQGLDATYTGGVAGVEFSRVRAGSARTARAGLSSGELNLHEGETGWRHLAFAEVTARLRQGAWPVRLTQEVQLQGSTGRTAGVAWSRGIASATLGAGIPYLDLRLEGTHGRLRGGTARYERFLVGGSEPLLTDPSVLSQRVALPAVPVGVLSGDRLTTLRASLGVMGVRPYFWAGTTGGEARDWYRLAGVEVRSVAENLPLLRLGGVGFLAGAAYTLDPPFEHELTFYSSLTLRP